MRLLPAAVLAAMALAGCASSGPTGSEVLTGSIKPGTARLVVYRTSPMGFAVQPPYVVNGHSVGPSQPNAFLVCELSPGRHEVSVANVPLNVNLSGQSDKTVVDLRAGNTAYLHAQPQLGLTVGVITLSQVTEGQGRADTAGLYKMDGDCPTTPPPTAIPPPTAKAKSKKA